MSTTLAAPPQVCPHGKRARIGLAALTVLGVASLGVMIWLPPVHQNPRYHEFADARTLWHIPNFWNVISNLPFLAVACFGLRALRSKSAFGETWERIAYITLLMGAAAVAFGSGYYHLWPNSITLFWDRLPMTLVFMSLLATTIGERISMPAGRTLLFPLVGLGVLSVLDWRISGDLRLYGTVQFLPMLALPVILLLYPPRYSNSGGLFAMMGLYLLAKALELYDHDLGAFISTGGHPWKHVAAAGALFAYSISVARRTPISAW